MGFTINQKPVLPTGAQRHTQGVAPVNPQTGTSETAPTSSSNQQYGMRDIPEEEKHKAITQEEMSAKLARGELMYGPIPQFPSLDAIDGIKFDYCDGLRIYVPKAADGEQPKKYFVHIVEEKFGVVLHSGVVQSDSYISTIQKFYTEFGLYIVKYADLPDDIMKNLKENLHIDDLYIQGMLELARYPEMTLDTMKTEFFSRRPNIEDKESHEKAMRDIYLWVEENCKFVHHFDPKGKELMVQLPVGTIGDSIGWFAYVERFQKKTGGKIICVMNPAISILFVKQYPDITFIEPKDTVKYTPYACYRIGLFFKGNVTDQPYDFRYIGNHRTASKILDTNDDDIAPRADLSAPRQIKEPYVCIAVQASAYCKLWTNPTGWHDVIKQLKDVGYRVLCIDKEPVTGQGIATNHIPWGVEDFTGNKPLQERIDLLKDCDFFIGLSSGVSWLAWCAKCPVVMISGFTNPFNEFYTPYRVINTLFCHGCWNDERCDFDHYDYMWCPRNKGTDKAYECSKTISSKYVMNVIKTIPAFQKQVRNMNNIKLAELANKYIDENCIHEENGQSVEYRKITPDLIEDVRMEYDSGVVKSQIATHLQVPDHCIDYIVSNIQMEK